MKDAYKKRKKCLRLRADIGGAADVIAPIEDDVSGLGLAGVCGSHSVDQILEAVIGFRGRAASRGTTGGSSGICSTDLYETGGIVLIRCHVRVVSIEHVRTRVGARLCQDTYCEEREIELRARSDQESSHHLFMCVPCVLHCDLHILQVVVRVCGILFHTAPPSVSLLPFGVQTSRGS